MICVLIDEYFLSISFFKIEFDSKAPTKHAIYSSHEQITKTYEELNNDVDKVANSLLNDFELKKGDVISLWSANSYNYILILYAGF